MGYYNDVAYAIVFIDKEDRDKVMDKLDQDQQLVIQEEALIDEDRILFHDTSTRWTPSRIVAQFGLTGDPTVDAHDALVEAAKDLQDLYYSSNGEEGVQSMGVFVRLGEQDDDTEREWWGTEEGHPAGFPPPHELVDYRREIVVGWE